MKKTKKKKRLLRQFKWRQPDIERLSLQFSIADSVLKEFVLGHSPSAVLTELVQNEYDAEGTRLEMLFGEDSVTVTGNGKPVDRAGWGRLSVIMGIGNVPGSNRMIKAKVNSIGSKNFGLRSLFIYGDKIYIRSGGRQTVLDLYKGTLPKPLSERSSQYCPGIHIEVPFRSAKGGDMEAFDVEKENRALDRFSKDLLPILIKLANLGSTKSLQELVVSSKRCRRRITWKQSVTMIPSSNKRTKVMHRIITMKDSHLSDPSSKHIRKLEEIEFQKNFTIPEQFKELNIPNYFRVAGGRIRLALSLRVRRGNIDLSEPGLFYYPLGLLHAYTGTNISINAPFQLDDDRTRIIDLENSVWNAWLLDRASDFTLELLLSDWLDRFGHQAYIALKEVPYPTITRFIGSLKGQLETEPCWPTRTRYRGRIKFACAKVIAVPADDNLDGFLHDSNCLEDRLASAPEVQNMVLKCGAKEFTINSLVRLRCFGSDCSAMVTGLSDKEANYHYTDFPDSVEDKDLQVKFALAIDSNRRKLSQSNRDDLRNSATTLAADGSLQAPSFPLWVIDPAILEVSPIPKTQRLHQSLVNSKTIVGLCRRFNGSDWARSTAKRIQAGQATEEEREALYRYIISMHGHLGRNTKALVRKLPVLRNHRGEWVAPHQITAKKTSLSKRLEPVLNFPNRDYTEDQDLFRAFRFKQRVEGKDLIAYAQFVGNHPEFAEGFEETLQKLNNLLTRPLVRKLSQFSFLPDSTGGIAAPPDLYLKNRLNYICLGDDAPFVQGTHVGLYKRLGCRDKPKADDIVDHLSKLNDRPEKPEIIYAALASALRMEGLPLDYYSEEPIIWNGKDYSSPENTLIGSRYRRIFLGAVPCIFVASNKLRGTFCSLGVCARPQNRHWKQLLLWFGQKYESLGGPVLENERKALLMAYRELGDIPEDLPPDTKCLLDRRGMLHDNLGVNNEQFLIDDSPRIAQAVVKQEIPLSFAETSEYGALTFFRNIGVQSLTAVQQRQKVTIGDLLEAPMWLDTSRILKQLHSPEFASALTALKEYELTGSIDNTPFDTSELGTKPEMLQRIAFTKEITGVYKISDYTIYTPENFALYNDSIILLRVRSHSEFFGYLSQALASVLINDVSYQRVLSDAIYRLLTCRSIREMKSYLHGRGIPWQPIPKALEDWEEVKEDEGEYGLSEDEISNMLTDILKQSVAKVKPGGEGDQTPVAPAGEPLKKQVDTPEPKPVSLPPIESIEVNILDPSGSWVPSAPQGGGSGGPSIWIAPEPPNKEWEQAVGRRGEEIIYHQELNRVKAMGYPGDRVVWVADTEPYADFDILSVDDDGEDIWIEVKSTTGRDGRFRWPKAEFEKALEKRNRYILWRVYETDSVKPSVKYFRDPIGILLRKGMRLDINNFYAMVEPMQA